MKNNSQKKLQLLLLLFSSYCLALVLFRAWITTSYFYLFLIWNLILAYVPYCITTIISKVRLKNFSFVSAFIVWLLFLPNASYIITDIFHLKHQTNVPIWFDLLLILSFALNGLLLFFLSVYDMHKHLLTRVSLKLTWLITIVTLLLSGFGIYLGRFLRWNSWDVISNPKLLMLDIIDRIINPLSHPGTWGVTFGYGILFLFGFILLKLIRADYREIDTTKKQ
ncbi:DUF1361 domain-containing protein [Aureibaculum sp. 2210JD6-5]|uniref:DUF1361 domain-containing protein n=1 Tax=Aureibaculum sp. 2210JD6-5 TaxID=3103957 RepID=UPI002AAEE8D6|nr:DUF1361 domain-containing protein [Aureibaculum sp. 2210JD6-5]MDY7394722.1 DUF1361 domain-containing protein [Aureibaculum sp. 2210JD6-5]